MKFPTSTKLAGVAVAAALTSSVALAEAELTKEIGLSGYVVGSARFVDDDNSGSSSTMDMDAFKLTAVGKFAPVTITASLYSGADSEAKFLDAFGTYDVGGGTTVTAGKFLSWLGYEAFDPVNMLQITYANDYTGFIPAYHTGIKFENSTDQYSIGVAVLDSVYSSVYYKGDGNLDNGVGLEGYFTYKGIKDFTFFTGLAYDKHDDWNGYTTFTADFWAQYVVGQTTFAGEICFNSTETDAAYSSPATDDNGYFWLALVKQQIDDKWSITGRLSGGEGLGGEEFLKFTVAPSIVITKNFEAVLEYSYTSYDNVASDNTSFLGGQLRFKF